LREQVLEASTTLIESVPTWKKGKEVKVVHLYKKAEKQNGPAWHARISRHPSSEVGFDRLWETLGPPDHFRNESKYISNLTHAEHLLSTSLGDVWALHYSFPNPVSPRVFVELQLYRLMDSSLENGHQHRSALVITLPFDIEEDEELKARRGNDIIGKYVSVERIAEIEGDKVEWRMATCSTPGGFIPRILSEFTIPGQIAKDVPHLIRWLEQNAKDGTPV